MGQQIQVAVVAVAEMLQEVHHMLVQVLVAQDL
jgi:hypothetical protein